LDPLLYLGKNLIVKTGLIFFLQKFVEVGVTYLVASFELAVVLALLLDGIVCQMHELVVAACGKVVFFARSPDVPFFVEPTSEHSFSSFEV